MKTMHLTVLAALAAACSGTPEFTPPKAPERPDPVAMADHDRLERKEKVAGRWNAALDSEEKGDASQKLRIDVLVQCIERAAKGEEKRERCTCIQRAIENGEDPYQTCQAAGAAEPSTGPTAKETGEEHPALTMAPGALPSESAPLWLGVVSTVPPPGWNSSIGMRFEPSRLPRQMNERGELRPACDLEMAYAGHLVAWTTTGSPMPLPLLIPVPDGAGMPMARDGAIVPGNVTSVLPRGMAGYVYFDRMIVGGRLVPVPADTVGKERNLRCWRSSVAVVNPGGAPALSLTTVLEGEAIGGTFSPGADPKRVPFHWFRRSLPAPTTPLWIPAPA